MKRFFKLVSMFVLAGATLAYTGCTDYDKDIDNLGQEVDALEGKLATLEQQVKNLEALKSQIETLKNTHDADVKRLDDAIAAINKALEGYATRDWANQTFVTKAGLKDAITALGVFATKTEVKEAKDAAAKAQADATKALGDVDALEKALGVYASEKAIQAALDGKLNTADFDKKFDEQLAAALKNDGKVTGAIAKAIIEAIDSVYVEFYSQLRSLVFIPELYVNGIESVEYTYAAYPAVKINGRDSGVDEKGVKWETLEAVNYGQVKTYSYIDPVKAVSYEMNPSSADIDSVKKFSFVSKEIETISKASAANPIVNADFISAKDGILTVGMEAFGECVRSQEHHGEATVFALQAVAKKLDLANNGVMDTTITSDYASIYASVLSFDAIAYSDKEYQAVDCLKADNNDHLYAKAKEAFLNVPTVRVAWNKNVDLADLVEIHYTINSDTKNAVEHAVYDMKENPYHLSFGFELIDYLSGDNKTSDSQFAQLKDNSHWEDNVWIQSVLLDPCGTDAGKANGEDSESSIGRRPLIRVTVKAENDDVILVGYIKAEIVRVSGPVVADMFDVTFKQQCAQLSWTCTWDEMVDNILEKTKLSKEEFDAIYTLETKTLDYPTRDVVMQYALADGEFIEAQKVSRYVGDVSLVKDKTVGTTTNVLKWSGIDPNTQQYIYINNGVTVYVRFVMKNQPPTSIYDGIYVPLHATVTKPEGNVTLKINEYWFNDGKDAVINVHIPYQDVNASTIPWTTEINQVWDKNHPKFNPTAGYDSYTEAIFAKQNGDVAKGEGGYKYYFAPEQPKFVVAGTTYQLSVASNKVFDINAVVGVEAKNAEIPTLEKKYSVDVTQGIYTNTELKVGTEVIATINQDNGIVTYNDQSATAKVLLNAFASQPRSEARLLANIGVTAYSPCGIAMSITDAINPYHFLRPIDIVPSDGVTFVDGVDSHDPEANLDVYGMFGFTDWRGRAFPGTGNALSWYFAYYGVKNVKVDINGVTTDLNGGTLGSTLLNEVTTKIELRHLTEATTPLGQLVLGPKNSAWTSNDLATFKKSFGYIHYENNGSTVEKSFKIRIPIEVTYDWGTIKMTVDATVKPTVGN